MVERVKEVTIAVYVDTNKNTYSEVFDDVEEGRDYLQGLCNDLFPDWSQKEIDKIKWISVKDRLPESSVGWTTVYGCILSRWAVQPGFYTQDSGIWVSRFVNQDEDYHNYLPFESVTHWMPLPEPPKE